LCEKTTAGAATAEASGEYYSSKLLLCKDHLVYELISTFVLVIQFEAELAAQTDMTYTVVRPTAFFKSVSGQLESIQNKGAPYVLFGDGAVTKCNPIAEEDLAYYMMDSAINDGKRNKILNIGGPDQPLTNQMLGQVRCFKAFVTDTYTSSSYLINFFSIQDDV